MLNNFFLFSLIIFFRYLFESYSSFEGNDLRCFYQSLLYNSKFGLAPEMINEDFSSEILCLQMKI